MKKLMFSLSIFLPTIAFASCPFPQYFKIVGPKNTSIMNVEPAEYSTILSIVKISDRLFQVNNIGNCLDENGLGAVDLKVGTDSRHYVDITFADDNYGEPQVIYSSGMNGFKLKTFEKTDRVDFKLLYAQE
jgi:hypothetical protein